MDQDQFFMSLWDQAGSAIDFLTANLAGADPQYLLLAMAVLIWIQLGRIVRALKGGSSLPKDLPNRVDNLQAKVQSMSNEIADFQVHAAARRRQLEAGENLPHLRDRAI